ncbi:MAG TPA: hypothetical protein VHT50_05985 [Mycobacterium sp.]|nr:hypothetical protein [Mycobacterium sp.]
MTDADLVRTRRSLHAVAELVLAGPQWRQSADIRLRVIPGGFRTVAAPDLRVTGADVISGNDRHRIAGNSATLAAALGVTAGMPEGVYHEGSGLAATDELTLNPDAAQRIIAAFEIGDSALRLLAPGEEPVLWPEHFDVGIRVDDINYGVSPGDGYLAEPYAYVGADPIPGDPFWNAPFGAARPMTEFSDAAAVRAFFAEGRDRRPTLGDAGSQHVAEDRRIRTGDATESSR